MTRFLPRLLAFAALASPLLITSSADACVGKCGSAEWQAAELLTPEVPADLGPMVRAIRGCQTPVLADVELEITGPSGVVAGTPRQIERVEGQPGGAGGYMGRDGRILVGFVPAASLQVGATYTVKTTLGATTTTSSFVAVEAWGALVPPALATPIVTKKVPTTVCCQGASGCGGGTDPDPYPSPAPVLETVPPQPLGHDCATLFTTDEPEAKITFPLPDATKKIFFDYRLYDQDSDKLLAFFSGRRLASAEHDVRLKAGQNRCFRLEMTDLLRDQRTSTIACTGPANVAPTIETHCDGLEKYASCKQANATLIEERCAAAGAGGTGAQAGGASGASGQAGTPGAAGQAGEEAGAGGIAGGGAGAASSTSGGAGAAGTGSGGAAAGSTSGGAGGAGSRSNGVAGASGAAANDANAPGGDANGGDANGGDANGGDADGGCVLGAASLARGGSGAASLVLLALGALGALGARRRWRG